MDEFTLILNCHGIYDDFMVAKVRDCTDELDNENDRAMVKLFWHRNRQVNDHAYFCLLAFQLEQFVKYSFARLCDRRLMMAASPDRIAWERVKAQKTDFLTMLRFLLPQDTHLYDRARELYRDRNKIAHEAELSLPIQMSATQRDIEVITTRIKTTLSTLEAAP